MADLDSYAPYDAGSGSNVTEDMWRNFMRHMLADGVIILEMNMFQVYADSTGMRVKVKSGECWVRGAWGRSTSEKILTIGTANASNPRIDTVVLRNDFVNNKVELAVLAGTAAASPVAPALTQNTSKWEIALADVRVDASVSTIAANKVTDRRSYTGGVNAYGKHVWTSPSNIDMPHNVEIQVTSLNTASDAGIATMSGGVVTLNSPGRWAVKLAVWSDSTQRGTWRQRMNWANGAFGVTDIWDGRMRGGLAGVSGAGFVYASCDWSGVVNAAQALQPIKFYVYNSVEDSATHGASTVTVSAEFLGGR